MSESMTALVYMGPNKMEIQTISKSPPKEQEVQIQVEKVGICGSEVSGYLGKNELRKPPLVMGHEFAGVVSEVGHEVKRLKAGDRVTVNPLVSCGSCQKCKSGYAQLCESRQLIGAARPGAFAEYVNVPEENVYILPETMTMEEGAMIEPLACAVHAARIVQLNAVDRLLIIGAGPIGLFVLRVAQILGLKDIVVQDINTERLESVKELGGIPVASPEELQQVKPLNGFTVTVDAVGLEVTRQLSIDETNPGGRVIFIGLHHSQSTLPINQAIRKEVSMYGSFAYSPLDFDTALEWMLERPVTIEKFVKHEKLENGNACFQELIYSPGKSAKILLSLN